jgi:hypothetical protein
MTKHKAGDSNSGNSDSKTERSRLELIDNTNAAVESALSSPPHHALSFQFLDLPQELQDMINNERWKEDGDMALLPSSWPVPSEDQAPAQFLLDYSQPTGCYHTSLPCWLLANKTIFQKGLKQLLTKSNLS